MLDFLFILLLGPHLLAMNVATAGPLVCIWLKRREVRGGDEAAGRLGLYLAWQSIWSLLVGIVLGLAATGMLWASAREEFFQALAAMPRRRLWFGIVELAFFAAVMLIYARTWRRVQQPRWWHPTLALLAATDLIYHFPPLFAVMAMLQQSRLPASELGYTEFLSLMYAPEVLARVAHFLLASAAVTGALILWYALREERHGRGADFSKLVLWGSRLALVPSLLQLLVGTSLLLILPPASQRQLMGGDWLATGMFAVSGVALFALLQRLGGLALGETERKDVVQSVWLMVLVVVAMTAARCTS